MDLVRQHYVNDLNEFIKQSEKRLHTIFKEINFTVDETLKSPNFSTNKIENQMWCCPSSLKLSKYQEFTRKNGRFTEPEYREQIPEKNSRSTVAEGRSTKLSLADITKMRRDAKRRRMKYRTKGSISYAEEVRGLIALQMESWEQYLQQNS